MKQTRTSRSISFMFTAMGLLAVAGAMAASLVITSRAAARSEGEARHNLLLLAWLSAALLTLCLLMLTWAVVRHAKYRMQQKTTRSETPYVDAWAEAGKRLKLEDEDQQAEGRENAQN